MSAAVSKPMAAVGVLRRLPTDEEKARATLGAAVKVAADNARACAEKGERLAAQAAEIAEAATLQAEAAKRWISMASRYATELAQRHSEARGDFCRCPGCMAEVAT